MHDGHRHKIHDHAISFDYLVAELHGHEHIVLDASRLADCLIMAENRWVHRNRFSELDHRNGAAGLALKFRRLPGCQLAAVSAE